MRYSRIQFRDKVVVTKTPYTAISEAESLDVLTVEPTQAYLIEDDGENFVRLTKAVGGTTFRVHWANVAGAFFAPPAQAEVIVPVPEPEPKGFPELPRAAVFSPKKRGPK